MMAGRFQDNRLKFVVIPGRSCIPGQPAKRRSMARVPTGGMSELAAGGTVIGCAPANLRHFRASPCSFALFIPVRRSPRSPAYLRAVIANCAPAYQQPRSRITSQRGVCLPISREPLGDRNEGGRGGPGCRSLCPGYRHPGLNVIFRNWPRSFSPANGEQRRGMRDRVLMIGGLTDSKPCWRTRRRAQGSRPPG